MTNPKKGKTLLSFFKRTEEENPEEQLAGASNVDNSISDHEQPPLKFPRHEHEEFDVDSFERDPGLRAQIWKYPVNRHDEIRRAYMRAGPYQPQLAEYKRTESGKQFRRFQYSWFLQFPWLEYSPSENAAFCFPCFLFEKNPPRRPAFTIDGFRDWKRVNDGKKCAFFTHMGVPTSPHNNAVKACEDLRNSRQHIDRVMNAVSSETLQKNRKRLETTVESVKWLAFQACAFRGHDESENSKNRGNFIELVKFAAKFNKDVDAVVLENAPKNAKYTSHHIQKEVLHIHADMVRSKIREEVGDGKFSILVDEAQDEAHREQMAVILRFVDIAGFIRERFFAVVSVADTTSLTLKKEISGILSRYNLHIHDMRGQGYDGASNMRGQWKGLQALFLEECPSAYYIHCFAHQLQLALVATAKDMAPIWLFFSTLASIVNVIVASPKRHREFKLAQADEIDDLLAIGELETGKGANQIGTVPRAGATRWSSHFRSVTGLLEKFKPSCKIVRKIMKEGATGAIRGEATGAYNSMMSFDFVFIMHLLHTMMGITEVLCQAVQQKSQDILNAVSLVSTTKKLLLQLRNNGWDKFLMDVETFCNRHDIILPDMSNPYMVGTRRSCQQKGNNRTTLEHYRFELFTEAIDLQLRELDDRFNEGSMELLTLSSALDPSNGYISFNIDHICALAERFYPQDFTTQELYALKLQLQHYELDIPQHESFKNLSTISQLCRQLQETRRSEVYTLIDRLLRLILTLPVSTATTERAFSIMKIIKTKLRNKMEDDFLSDAMILNIEKEIAGDISSDMIMDVWNELADRRAPVC